MVPQILASLTGFRWSIFRRQLYTGDVLRQFLPKQNAGGFATDFLEYHFSHCVQRLQGESSTVNYCGKMR